MNYNNFEDKEYSNFISKECTDCRVCVSQCAFLKKYGTPGKVAEDYLTSITREDGVANLDSDKNWLKISYQCSLCGLCSVLCPVKLSPDKMFLEIRREAVNCCIAPLPEHKPIIAYEKRGTSKKYSWYSLPKGCSTVLFPGCNFSGSRPDSTLKLYELLKTKEPTMGMVLDCCCKPSHDLGRSDFFDKMFDEMRSWLVKHGVKTMIVVCPNCYKVFKNYGYPLEVVSAYEQLVGHDHRAILPNKSSLFSIHDPCVLRNEPEIHNAVRALVESAGFKTKEMPHNKKKTLCCGEGASVGFVCPQFASNWGDIRKKEAQNIDSSILAYCAGCTGVLNKKIPTHHIIDALFYPESVVSGTRKVSKAPFTYINRIKLKHTLKKNYTSSLTRERDFTPMSNNFESNKSSSNSTLLGYALKYIFNILTTH